MSKENPVFQIGQFLDPSFNGLSKNELTAALQQEAAKVEEGSYVKRLGETEIAIAKSDLADVSIQLARIAEEKKDAMDQFKEMLKIPTQEHKNCLEMIRTGIVRQSGIIYWIDDQERQMMYAFDSDAICVDARPMTMKERQLSINSERQVFQITGTDDKK